MPKGRGRRQRNAPVPRANPKILAGESPLNLLTLDRFSEADLDKWLRLSARLDELARLLYFAVEPERLKRQGELIEALNQKPAAPIDFEGWVRVVDTKWTLSPLSSIGSLKAYGGRFNIGRDVVSSSRNPFPALYVGENFETAYRERFQIEQGQTLGGLTAEELALGASTSSYRVRGHVARVLDASSLASLAPIAKVLAKFKMPAEAVAIAKLLKMRRASDMMIRSAESLRMALQVSNWRVWPVQYELPAPSQIFGDLARAAGYEAIRYRSTKSRSGYCLAVLSGNLGSDRTFVELMDPAAPEVDYTRLDLGSSEHLAGWECLSPSARARME